MTPASSTPVVGYCRVSTEEQGDSGNGLDAQEEAIRRYADERGWELTLVREVASGKTLAKRPILAGALEQLRAKGGPELLIVTKLDRLSRYAPDAILLADGATREGWGLAVLDMGGINLDTTTAAGKAHLGMMAVMAQMYRDQISENTKAALKAKKARGESVGRPRATEQSKRPEEAARMAYALERIKALRGSGLSYRAMADVLNSEGVRGPQGGGWFQQSVRMACIRYNIKGGK